MLLPHGGAGKPQAKKQTQKTLTKTERSLKAGQPPQQLYSQQLILAPLPASGKDGLVSESLVTSYLTGSGSMASHKWMCSSKSAKNMVTSCSLGPKTELR